MKEKTNQISKQSKGITLISLVITIIVLLILAGVSIAMLTGENGILTQATKAAEETARAAAKEQVDVAILGSYDNLGKVNEERLLEQLWEIADEITGTESGKITEGTLDIPDNDYPIKVTIDGYDIEVQKPDSIETGSTKPEVFLPEGGVLSTEETEDEIQEGLVMTLAGNEYVWIPVPESIFTTATSKTDYTNIEADIHTYTADYRTSFTDTHAEYNTIKEDVLESIYDNNGFWVGRYEAGTETLRTSSSAALTSVVIKEGAYPYNYVTIGEAQERAQTLSVSGKYNASLMFGFQWDLILKFMEVSGNLGSDPQNILTSNSTSIGNYYNTLYTIKKGKYSTDDGDSFSDGTNQSKTSNTSWLLTTGATIEAIQGGSNVTNNVLNIYDVAGNVLEWTLEKSSDSSFPSVDRGGLYFNGDSNGPAGNRSYCRSRDSYDYRGFRSVLY